MKYAMIKPNDIVDGIGICVSFWVQGCCHYCDGCHNKETWDRDGGIDLPPSYIEDIIQLLQKNGVKRNLSILGGEPLTEYNVHIVYMLVKMIKKALPDTKIFLWTGFTFEKLLHSKNSYIVSLIRLLDVLIDGKFELENRDITLWLRGSPNQRVIDVQASLKSGETCLLDREIY